MEGQLSIFDYAEKTGRWVKEWDTGSIMLKCSNCESRVIGVHYARAIGENGWRFCPYCGAVMQDPDKFRRPWPHHIASEWRKEEAER